MQDAREQRVSLSGTPDMDDAAALKLVGEHIDDHLEHIVVEGTERAVDEYPGWILQQDPGDGEAELLVLIQFSIPAEGGVEQRRQPFETQAIEGAIEGTLLETLGLQRIGEDLPQGSAGHVRRAAGQVEYLFARRPRDVSAAPRPQPRQCPKKLSLARPRRAQNEHALSGPHDHLCLFEPVGVRRGYDLQIVDRDGTGLALGVGDAALESLRAMGAGQRMAEIGDAQQGGPPVGNGAEIVDEPPQRGLRLGERAGRHHQAAERNLAAEIQRRRDENGCNYRDPAEAGFDPFEIGMAPDDAARRREHIVEMQLDAAFLVRLPLGQRNVVDMLVDAHQRKTQIRFTRVTLRIAADEADAHPVAEQRTRARIEDRRPHHEAGDRVVPVSDAKNEVVRQTPENARETEEQYRRLQQLDGEVGRQLTELARILVYALIRVDPDRSGIGQPKRLARQHPILKQAEHQPLAQLELQSLDQPALRHIQNQQNSRDDEEDAELE